MNACVFAMVRCSANVAIHWRRTDGASIPPNIRFSYLDFGTRLQIAQLQHSDEGAYSCTGSNQAGRTEFPIQLLVHGRPPNAVSTYKRLVWLQQKHCFKVIASAEDVM